MTYFLKEIPPFRRRLAQNKPLLGKNWPIGEPLCAKNTRGYPCFWGYFIPFLVIF
jgi:hypothetical protein